MALLRKMAIRPARPATRAAVIGLALSGLLALVPFGVSAQQGQPSAAGGPSHRSFFDSIGRWFDEQTAHVSSTFEDAGKKIKGFGQDAGKAARTTGEGAKDAADAVMHLPDTRVISDHEKCVVAANGAPDCAAAAEAMCKKRGFKSGKSLDMTSRRNLPGCGLSRGSFERTRMQDRDFRRARALPIVQLRVGERPRPGSSAMFRRRYAMI